MKTLEQIIENRIENIGSISFTSEILKEIKHLEDLILHVNLKTSQETLIQNMFRTIFEQHEENFVDLETVQNFVLNHSEQLPKAVFKMLETELTKNTLERETR